MGLRRRKIDWRLALAGAGIAALLGGCSGDRGMEPGGSTAPNRAPDSQQGTPAGQYPSQTGTSSSTGN